MNPIDRSIVLDEARRYTDSQRIAYIEPGKVVLPETTVSIKEQSDGNVGIIGGLESPVMVGIEEGKRYALSVDGLLYYCTPLIEKEGDYEIRYIYTTMDTTDEAFLLLTEVYENGVPLEYATQVRASVAGDRTILLSTTETIHPIDPKFLPGVCLPVVELSTVFVVGTSDAITIVDETDIKKLNDTISYGLPIVVKIATNMYDRISGVLYYVSDSASPDNVSYSGIICNSAANAILGLTKYDGEWTYQTKLMQ